MAGSVFVITLGSQVSTQLGLPSSVEGCNKMDLQP